jgi:hypothetical protein
LAAVIFAGGDHCRLGQWSKGLRKTKRLCITIAQPQTGGL